MFLTLCSLSRRQLYAKWLVSALFLLPQIPLEGEPTPPCILDVPVYNPFGDRLLFKVISVAFTEGTRRMDILGRTVDGISTTSTADRIFFSSNRIVGARPIEVTLEGPNRVRISSKMIVTECRLRRSLFFGESNLGYDVTSIAIKGRLSGCQFVGDWWVRAMPMFGGHFGSALEDGFVESDGKFWLNAGTTGVRHLLVIGKGKQPIKVIGIDVTVGDNPDLGVVDLAAVCPQ
jgi:hypothetical protein